MTAPLRRNDVPKARCAARDRTIERGKLVGKRRGRQFGPVGIAGREAATCSRPAIGGLAVAQHTLAVKMSNEVALLHPHSCSSFVDCGIPPAFYVAFKASAVQVDDATDNLF
jgi:hypothetical protein